MIKPMGPAGPLMEGVVRRIARERPDLGDGSGRGFWPTPALFPLLLAKCLHLLQESVSALYLARDWDAAETLAACRCDLVKIVREGDLGENHTRLFIDDHPAIEQLTDVEVASLPFFRFCGEMRKIDDPLILFGALMRNEEGSIGEMVALRAEKMVSEGEFAEVHLEEEEEHGRLAESIRVRIEQMPRLGTDFLRGYEVHDRIYLSLASR